MQEDLGLQGFRFNWALTIFYIPYLLQVLPVLKGVYYTKFFTVSKYLATSC